MPDLSRRGFLGTAGLTAAGVALVAVPGVAVVAPELSGVLDDAAAPTSAELSSVGPLVVHVRDAAAGELSVLTGESEVVIHDPGFVARIVSAAVGR
jgi:hypothetical protein